MHPKNALMELCKARGLSEPVFETRSIGPEHEPLFMCDVLAGNQLIATGQGRSKREAEKIAAEVALEMLQAAESQPAAQATAKSKAKPAKHTLPEPSSWPIFPEVLAETLRIANQRLPERSRGEEAGLEVARLAGEMYMTLLEELTQSILQFETVE